MKIASKLCLASASPRRQELLAQLGIEFVVQPSRVPEVRQPGELARHYVLRLAEQKAREVWVHRQARGEEPLPVLGADTAVVLGEHIFGKPGSRSEAAAGLRRLSGRSHHVFSAIALMQDGRVLTAVNCTRVTFTRIDESMLEAYLDTREAEDKAGGYGIQGQAAQFVSRIEGSYSGVMGLPLYELGVLLRQSGWFKK